MLPLANEQKEIIKNDEIVTMLTRYRKTRSSKVKVEITERLVRSHIHFVYKIALRIGGNVEDSFQNGMIGLLNSIKNFNPQNKKAKFSTYAGLAIERNIRKGLARDSIIRVPEHLFIRAKIYQKVKDNSAGESELKKNLKKYKLDMHTVEELEANLGLVANLYNLSRIDKPRDDMHQWEDILEDENATNPEENAENMFLFGSLNEIVSDCLKEREYNIIRKYLWEDKSVKEVALDVGLSPQSVSAKIPLILRKIKVAVKAVRKRETEKLKNLM